MRVSRRRTPDSERCELVASTPYKAPEAFEDDLERGMELITALPAVGEPVLHPRLSGVRRVLLVRIRYHLYYQHEPGGSTVDVLALWHTGRGTGPPLS